MEVVFSLELDQKVYWDSDWGDPPQIAVWLQEKNSGAIRTAMVTHRTGRGDWEGKPQCPVSLPYWVSFYNKETGTKGPPSWTEPAPDGVTRATPPEETTIRIAVPAGSEWLCFIEVNCSGDFNDTYRSFSEEGVQDAYGNGQPSVVYRGEFHAAPGAVGLPRLVGRTRQHTAESELIEEVGGITTAKRLIRNLRVTCE